MKGYFSLFITWWNLKPNYSDHWNKKYEVIQQNETPLQRMCNWPFWYNPIKICLTTNLEHLVKINCYFLGHIISPLVRWTQEIKLVELKSAMNLLWLWPNIIVWMVINLGLRPSYTRPLRKNMETLEAQGENTHAHAETYAWIEERSLFISLSRIYEDRYKLKVPFQTSISSTLI